MKLNFTQQVNGALNFFLPVLLLLAAGTVSAQTYPVTLGSPSIYIYGLSGNGEIDEINITTGATHQVIKNTTYSGNAVNQANGLGYNAFNGKFYYFKRNVGTSPEEFVSFNPVTGNVTILAASTCTATTHTGCVNATGTGYYTIDVNGTMSYYNIALNTWTKITSNFVDQDNNNVTSIIKAQNSGDMAIDGYGNVWLVTSSNSNYGLYEIMAPLPTVATAQIKVKRFIAPTTATPAGKSFMGIAFDVNGDILLASSEDKLYRLQTTNSTSLIYVSKFAKSGMSNDLTSQSFPTSVLPVKWLNFSTTAQNNGNVALSWTVSEENNKGFYVERSLDGKTWETVTFVPSKNQTGTDVSYAYTYNSQFYGTTSFRIKQVDLDGSFSYSPVRSLQLGSSQATVSIWPNPARDYLNITGQGSESTGATSFVQLFDQAGRMIARQQLQPGVNTVDMSRLTAGIYIARVQCGSQLAYTQKILKQ
ncbi:MAG TPA: T9SS type A sorting domain-containing protein [Chitinophagaceae bacterium]|nr:T9SS type A sorting domain-containing protein [Chitinophagaceae bacterium]